MAPDTKQISIRVLVAEDEEPLRNAICDLLDGEPDIEVVGRSESALAATRLASELRPDVALLDVRMEGGGPGAARAIGEMSPNTRIVALSAYDDQATVIEMLRSGAIGYLVKGVAPVEVVDAVRRAARGEASFSSDVISGVVTELTGDAARREETEKILRASEERFRALLESAPDAVVIADEEGRIVLVNAETERLFRYAREELLGRKIEMLLPERFRERHPNHRESYLEDAETRPMGIGLELAGRRSDGTEFDVDISLSTIDTAEGRLVTAQIRDITERRRAEDVRRTSEARFAALLESAPDAVVIADSGGGIVLINEQTERLFGYDRQELVGAPLEKLLPERFRTRHVGHRSDYLAEPQTRPMGAGLELAGLRKDGSEFPVDISLSTIDTAEGRLMTAFVRDVSDRRAQEEQRRELAERRDMLAHLVSASEEQRRRIADDIHDDSIQVITAAGMRLQILRRTLSDPTQLAALDELEQTIQLAIGRLRNLLFELRPPVLDNEGLSAALEMYLDEAQRGGGARYDLEDKLTSQPLGEARVILYRIVQEALTNARKHADAKNVTVSLLEREGGHLVRIRDDGVGFDAANLTQRPGHLGIAAMRERASLAGGWLHIESESGAGTRVEVWLPGDRPH